MFITANAGLSRKQRKNSRDGDYLVIQRLLYLHQVVFYHQ